MKHLGLNQPHVIVMVGIPGSGKTFFAEKFADTFGAPYLDYKKIMALTGNNSDMTESLMQYQLNELLKTRQSIILEGNTESRASRVEISKQAKEVGYETLFIWVQTDAVTAKTRATKTTKNKADTILTSEEYDRIAKRFTAPATSEKPVVISGKHTYASQVKVVLQRLSAPRAAISTHTKAPTRLEHSGRRNITVR